MLFCRLFIKKEDHTAQNIQNDIEEVISEFNIENKIVGCVHDNAANVVCGVGASILVKHSLNCVAHSLQLAINTGLKKDPISKVVAAASKLVGHFKHSNKAANYLREKQVQLGLPQHKLLQRCVTRWNSTLDMVERLVEQRWALCSVLSDRRCTKLSDARILELKDTYWTIMEDIIPILQPLKLATVAVSQDLAVSLSCVTPILTSLVNNHLSPLEDDNDVVRNLKATVKVDIKSRFPEIFNFDIHEADPNLSPYIIASFLDPRHKHFPYFSDEQREFIFNSMNILESFTNEKAENNQERSDSNGEHEANIFSIN